LERVVAIHNDITTGSLAQLGIKVGSNILTGIRADLSKLAQVIGGGANDAIIKQESDRAKEATKTAPTKV
jgi:glutamate-1-semialdehyde aminotransferase